MSDEPTATIEVTTTAGVVRGIERDGVTRFAGIPFAQPPTGALRFRPPVPVQPWEGVRSAESFGAVSPQNPSVMEMLFGGEAEQWDEDCLHLNVWTPQVRTETPLPVMVWIHGGGFEMGSGSSPLYDGTSFARDGVVIVTINYRLGAFGFLELGHLDPALAGSGNNGLLDQITALEWVQANIAAFGGDPNNVTVFGESAGAMSISLLLTMPRAKGLFHRAITESGAANSARTPEQAVADATEFLGEAGLSGIDDLRAAAPETLLSAHAAMAATRLADPEGVLRRTGDPISFLSFRPVADGESVPTDPLGQIAAGTAEGITLLAGTNLEEWKLFALMTPTPDTDDALRQRVGLLLTDADAAVEVYRAELGELSVGDLECAVLTDRVFRTPTDQLIDAQAAHAEVFQYRWNWASPALGGLLGASHAIEIPFVFDMVEDHRLHVLVGADAPVGLSQATHGSWIAFARDGVPAFDGLPEWPSVNSGGDTGRPVMVLDVESELVDDPQAKIRAFWLTPEAVQPPVAPAS